MQHDFTCGVLSDVVNDVSISMSSRSSNELHGQKFIANTDGLKTYNFSLFSIALKMSFIVIFGFLSRTTGPISTNLGTSYTWMKGI